MVYIVIFTFKREHPMKININTNQYNEALCNQVRAQIAKLPGIKFIGDETDYEVISVLGPGRSCIRAIVIALREGIAD